MIEIDRELTLLDKFAIDVAKVLDACGRYVIVSGFVAIALGRSRGTEDIDFIFSGNPRCVDREIAKDFWCLNAKSFEEAWNEGVTPRIAWHGRVIPNAEIKPPRTDIEKYALENPELLKLKGVILKISPIELQIAYKLWLRGEKDIEDAIFLYEFLKERIVLDNVVKWLTMLGVKNAEERVREILG